MREKVRDSQRIMHILESIENLQSAISKWGKDQISSDKTLYFGLVRYLEIIGEASYMVSSDFKSAHPSLPWKSMEKMRHVLVHGYYTLHDSIIWATIEHDIPSLHLQIKQLITDISAE